MAEPVAFAALAAEAAIGYPDALYRRIGHPVGWFARIIRAFEHRWNRTGLNPAARRLAGLAAMLILLTLVVLAMAIIQLMAFGLLPSPFDWLAVALIAVPGLAQRSLHQHVAAVELALQASDIPTARTAVGLIVGRDTDALDPPGIARAAIETLSESFNDGVSAPLFWLLIAGLPGLYAYKAANTADSLIGHKDERYQHYGWAAARIDDLLNLIPARIAGPLICSAGMGGWRTMFSHAGRHASPNAGWPEAAMAGALGLRLGGPVSYDGVTSDKAWLGHGRADATAADIRRALAIYRRACLLLWVIAGGIAWLF